jgi:hypothetical protein
VTPRRSHLTRHSVSDVSDRRLAELRDQARIVTSTRATKMPIDVFDLIGLITEIQRRRDADAHAGDASRWESSVIAPLQMLAMWPEMPGWLGLPVQVTSASSTGSTWTAMCMIGVDHEAWISPTPTEALTQLVDAIDRRWRSIDRRLRSIVKFDLPLSVKSKPHLDNARFRAWADLARPVADLSLGGVRSMSCLSLDTDDDLALLDALLSSADQAGVTQMVGVLYLSLATQEIRVQLRWRDPSAK